MQDQQLSNYVLSSTIKDHLDQVRSVCSYPTINNGLVTCSLDRTIKVWQHVTDENTLQQIKFAQMTPQMHNEGTIIENHYELVSTLLGHSNFVVDIEFWGKEKGNPQQNGNVISASHDKSFAIWDITTAQETFKMLDAHSAPISCIAIAQDGTIITGSWDKTAKVWQKGTCVATLSGHSMNVLAVLPLSNGDIVTGCGDSTISIWKSYKLYKQFKAHQSCVRGLAELPGLGFISCSNDGYVKTWSLLGEELFSFFAHNNLVYSVYVTQQQEIITASEDRTVKIWKDGKCVQTIEHPGCVWRAVLLQNGDLATACSDCCARVFTKHKSRVASENALKTFKKQVEQSKQKTDTSKLPDEAALTQPGKKDGEIKVVNVEGSAKAFSWNQRKSEWELVGDVVDGPGMGDSFAGKQVLDGKMYDYVFDIDLEGRMLKIGYNLGENPYSVAQDFIWKHDIGQGALDAIARFIIKNTPQDVPSQSQVAVDPFTGASRFTGTRATSAQTSAQPKPAVNNEEMKKNLEQREREKRGNHFERQFEKVEDANFAGIAKKVKELNEQLKSSEFSVVSLSPQEVSVFDDLISALSSNKHKLITSEHLQLLDKMLKWPSSKVFPVIDILRLVILDESASKLYAQLSSQRNILSDVMSVGFGGDSNETLQMLTLRFITNLFVHSSSNPIFGNFLRQILQTVAKCESSKEARIKTAYAKVLHNAALYLCLFEQQNDMIKAGLCDLIKSFLQQQSSGLAETDLYIILCAIGCLIVNSDVAIKNKAKAIGLDAMANQQVFHSNAKVAGVAFQIVELLKQ